MGQVGRSIRTERRSTGEIRWAGRAGLVGTSDTTGERTEIRREIGCELSILAG